jgi:hypothetical protein
LGLGIEGSEPESGSLFCFFFLQKKEDLALPSVPDDRAKKKAGGGCPHPALDLW